VAAQGDLTMTDRMEQLLNSLFLDQVPANWVLVAYPSLKTLGLWFTDMLRRYKQLEKWSSDLNLPAAVWLPGLFNPQSMLTAIMQVTARKNQWPLDKVRRCEVGLRTGGSHTTQMVLATEVTKKIQPEEVGAAPREGAYIYGLFIEGARWDLTGGLLKDSLMKELYPLMPVIYLKAIPRDKQETKDIYRCPLYSTRRRGPTYVWSLTLRTKDPEFKWILAGVALLLQD
jgi:dynein heavy chain